MKDQKSKTPMPSDQLLPPPPSGWPEPMKPEALYSFAGEIVRTIGSHTESDPAGLVLQNLVGFGNIIDSCAHFTVESTRHAMNLFLAEVGPTSKGRKGTGWGHIFALYREVDPKWSGDRVQSGLRTGEGLVRAVCDESDDGPGEADKRLLAFESEMGELLRVMERRENTLSTTLRQAWDGGTLRVLTKKSPLRSNNAHISVIAQTTQDDLSRYLGRTDIFNGFGNRFLWGCVRRSKLLAEGGQVPEHQLHALVLQLKDAVKFARTVEEVRLSESASDLWRSEYPNLTADVPGILGAVTSRAEAQVRRIATIYALMDERDEVRVPHLRAALAVWDFCFESAKYIFGGRSKVSLSDKLRDILRKNSAGMTRTEISDALYHHASADAIESALEGLQDQGLVESGKRVTRGRTAERWIAIASQTSRERDVLGKTGRNDT